MHTEDIFVHNEGTKVGVGKLYWHNYFENNRYAGALGNNASILGIN